MMKKFTFIFAFVAASLGLSYGQVTSVVTSPTNNATSAFRLPNGTSAYAYFRGASLVLPTELTSIPVSTTLTSVGFTTTAGASSASTGTITIYLQNTGDVTFNKGGTWTGITPGMTTVYTGTMTVPASATSFDLPLTTPFVFLGSGMYIAYDYVSAGPFAVTSCTWASNNTLSSGCVAAGSPTASPATCFPSNWRPCVRFGYPNPLTNDVSVECIKSMGNIPAVLGLSTGITAIVKNNSNTTLTNINVSANAVGVNPYSDVKTVASLAAGASSTVSFNSWTTTAMGASTINVTVPGDQNNTNNAKGFNSVTSCNTGGVAENPANYTQSIGFNTASGILSTMVQIPVAATVTGVNMAISSNTAAVGNGVYGVMLDNLGAILAVSVNTLVISAGDFNTIRSFTFNPPVAVTASQVFYLGMAQPANTLGYFPFGAYVNPFLSTSYFTNAIGGGTLALLATNLGQFGIEANLGGICGPLGINTIVSADNNLTVYPNPSSSSVFVKLGSVNGNASVTVYNAIGQVVIEAKEFNGDSAEINVNSLSKGIYILKVTNGKEVSNTKIVVEH